MVNTYNAKSVLLGEPAVGKTSIRRRYMGQGFNKSHLMTIGADFTQRKIEIDENNIVNLQIWDVAGQDQFKHVRSRFLLNANICLMVFDLTRRETFMRIGKWMNDFWQINPSGEIPLLIVGNKTDLEKQVEVSKEDMVGLVKKLQTSPTSTAKHVSCITTSAATGMNISEAFRRVAHQITTIFQDKYGNG